MQQVNKGNHVGTATHAPPTLAASFDVIFLRRVLCQQPWLLGWR